MKAVAAGALVAFAVTGCSSSGTTATGTDATSDPVVGGTITAALAGDPTTMDSGVNSGSLTIAVGSQIFEPLFALDKTFTVQPMLADSYELSDDGLTYTIALRSDVPFQDGTTMEAEDVVASLERWMTVSATGIDEATRIASVEAPDAATVVITLSTPSYSLIGSFANSVQAAIIMPAEIAEAAGSDLLTDDQLVGTGPYSFVSYTPGQNVELKRFDDYASRTEEDWGGGAGAKHQYADTIKFVFVTDDAQRLNGLKTGQWNWAQSISADDVAAASEDPSLKVVQSGTHLMPTLLLNHNSESAMATVEARQALNLMLDKASIAAATMGPQFLWKLAPGMVGDNNATMFSDEGADVYEAFDVDEAKQMFADAGVTSIKILSTQTYSQFYQTSVLLQAALEEIGVTAEIEIFDFPTMIEKLSSDPTGWDVSMTRFSGLVTSPTQILPLSKTWPGEYESDELDSLLADYQSSTDADAAHGYVDQIQALVYKEMPFITLADQGTIGIYSSKLNFPDNFTSSLYNAWISE